MKIISKQALWLLIVFLAIFLTACQESSQEAQLSERLTASPFALPPTWTPTTTMEPTATPPIPITATISPMPLTQTSEWYIPPLDLHINSNNYLIYTTGKRGSEVYVIHLDKFGTPLKNKVLWWYTTAYIADIHLSPNGEKIAVWTSSEGGDNAYFFNPLNGIESLPEGARNIALWDDVPGGYYARYLGWISNSQGILFSQDGSTALIEEGKQTLLPYNPADYSHTRGADISPDGRYLVYSLSDSESGDAQDGTWLLDLENQTAKMIFDKSVNNLTWSPNGQWIAFTDEALMIMRPDGTDLQTIHPGRIRDSFPAWSPQGDALAFFASGPTSPGSGYDFDSNTYVAEIDAQGAVTVRPAIPGSEYGYIDPSWSPNGEFLLLVSGVQGDADIWLVNRNGNIIHQITTDGGPKRFPVWFQIKNP